MDSLYKALLMVVESESLLRAADKLHVSQPTMSRQIQQLEEQLGTPLFDRVGKRLILNRAGELAYEVAKRCVGLEQRLHDDLHSLGDPEVGTIHIGAGLTPSIHLLPPLLAAYRRAHPGVRFSIQTGSSRAMLAALRQRDVDVAVVTTLGRASDPVTTRPLIDDPLLLVAAPAVQASPGTAPVSFASLAQRPFVLLDEGSGLRDLVLDLAHQHGVALSIAAETDSLESISRLVQAGVGVSILPASSVREDIQAGRVLALPTDVALPSRTIRLVVPADRAISAAASLFVAQLDYHKGAQ